MCVCRTSVGPRLFTSILIFTLVFKSLDQIKCLLPNQSSKERHYNFCPFCKFAVYNGQINSSEAKHKTSQWWKVYAFIKCMSALWGEFSVFFQECMISLEWEIGNVVYLNHTIQFPYCKSSVSDEFSVFFQKWTISFKQWECCVFHIDTLYKFPWYKDRMKCSKKTKNDL